MDPLSITGTVLAILQLAGNSAQGLNKLLSLRGAPQQLQQMWNEAEALRALLLETQYSLYHRRESNGYVDFEAALSPILQTVRDHVLEFDQLIHENVKTKVLQIQRIILTSQDTIHDLGDRQRELQNEIGQSKISFQQNLDETQAYVRQSQAHTDSSLLQMHTEQRQNVAALQHSFTTSIQPLLTQMEQMTLAVNQSTSKSRLLACNAHVVATANLDGLLGAGAKISVNIPLIIPEENHIVWSLVIAGNLEQLRHLLSLEKNLIYARNQWGQSIMHVAAKIHQPAVFNFLITLGMDEHLPDENQKTAATTVLTRRGSEKHAPRIDVDDLADRLGWTPLHEAAALTREGRQLNETLLESQYDDINSKDTLGRTPLHWLAENGESDAIRLLTQDPWRADVHTRDLCGFTALHCACWADDFDSAAVLLDAGSNVNARDKHKRPPLFHFDSNKLLDLVIEKGADVYITDDEGANIMHHVAIGDQAALGKTLLEQCGHTICVTNRNGDTPLGLAIQNNSLEFLATLLPFLKEFPVEKVGISNYNKRNVLHLAALHASTEVIDMLTRAKLLGLDEEAQDKDGHPPNECFLKCRASHCAVARKSFDAERRSWVGLMKSARTQAEDSTITGDECGEVTTVPEDPPNKRENPGLSSDTNNDNILKEGYVNTHNDENKILEGMHFDEH